LGCWIAGFIHSAGLPFDPGPHATSLWNQCSSFLKNKALVIYAGSLLLLFITSAVISRGCYLLLILRNETSLPFLFFLLFSSTNPDTFPLQASSVALLFLLVSFYKLYCSYQVPLSLAKIYNATVSISLGSLLWAYLLWFIPLLWYGLYIFRISGIRTFFASVLGFFTVYWFVLAWCVWQHDYSLITDPFKNLADVEPVLLQNTVQIGRLVPSILILFIVISVYITLVDTNALRTRRYYTFLLTFCIYSFVLAFIYGHSISNLLTLFFIPASIILSCSISNKSGFTNYLTYYGILALFVMLFIVRLWNY
jgi:hypothetical protein